VKLSGVLIHTPCGSLKLCAAPFALKCPKQKGFHNRSGEHSRTIPFAIVKRSIYLSQIPMKIGAEIHV
jgi:hypothetical protein